MLPEPRGPLSRFVVDTLAEDVHAVEATPVPDALDPISDDDLQLALYVLYELHYQGFDGVPEAWEWEPSMLGFRRELESHFEAALASAAGGQPPGPPEEMDLQLRAILDSAEGPSLSQHIERAATLQQFLEFVVHRSAYQLKEADPHSWAIPRLTGRPKAALVEIQADEYGGGVEARMHSVLFGDTMEALGLDRRYGAYLDQIPGVTLATVNLMSLLGLHRRRRGALVGHLALFEMASAVPNRRYGNALRRLGVHDDRALAFYDEHVEADSVHDNIAAVDLAGGLAHQDSSLAGDILFGARALVEVDRRFDEHVLGAWERGEPSLRTRLAHPAHA